MRYKEILKRLKSLYDPEAVAGMARYGIRPEKNYGVSVSTLRKMAKSLGRDHKLAQQLWSSGIRDARILATLIDDPKMVTEEQMESWAKDIDSWDVCDSCCGNLFDKTLFAYQKAIEWGAREEEFVKRAGFALIAWLPVHDKKAEDEKLLNFLPIIKREAADDRNYVKKAVNWALRNIGKRNPNLNREAIKAAKEIKKFESKSAKWIANDALRELTSDAVRKRLEKRARR